MGRTPRHFTSPDTKDRRDPIQCAHLAAGLLNEGDRDEGGQHIDNTSDHGGQECAALGVDGLEDNGCVEHDGVDACPLLEARNHCGHNLCGVLQSLSGMFIALQALS